MRVRHRIPSIFSLSMVDVLCCALGCVILLWLINLRDAKQHEDDTKEKLQEANSNLMAVQENVLQRDQRISALDLEKAALIEQKTALLLASRELEAKRKDATGRIATLSDELKASNQRIVTLNSDLKERNDRITALAVAADLLPGLKTELKQAQERLTTEQARMLQTNKELEKARSQQADLTRSLDARDKELGGLRLLKDQMSTGKDHITALEKQLAGKNRDLTQANESLLALQEEKKIWQTEANRARTAVDNRFAGIQLSGKRAIFLVDMSGSMELVDEKTPAPNKWSEVTNSIGRVMRSLPELQQVQVIVFSLKTTYLFPGTEGKWLDYDPRTTPDRVVQALNQLKPKDGTNMYAAMETAFRYRESGLDTLYVFSDGLPNMGVGVSNEEAAKLTELQLGERLGKHIRKTLQTIWNNPLPTRPRVKINTIGFFYESPDVGAFLWALARENEGSFVGMSKP